MSIDHEKLRAFANGELSAEDRAQVEAALAMDAGLREELAAHRHGAAFGSKRGAKWSVREWVAMAASLAAGLAIAFAIGALRQPSFAIAGGALVARGDVARALDSRLAADAGGEVRIGLTFRNREGRYCRTFSVQTTVGLACHHDRAWRVAVTTEQTLAPSETRGAASNMPAPVLDAANAMIVGEVLSAAEERSARRRGWN